MANADIGLQLFPKYGNGPLQQPLLNLVGIQQQDYSHQQYGDEGKCYAKHLQQLYYHAAKIQLFLK